MAKESSGYKKPSKEKVIREMVDKHPDEVMDALLEQPFWPRDLQVDKGYSRVSDDTDGGDPQIIVSFSRDGDGWVQVTSTRSEKEGTFQLPFTHRFRNGFGGGSSLRVRNALLILARAIDLDNIAHKDRP